MSKESASSKLSKLINVEKVVDEPKKKKSMKQILTETNAKKDVRSNKAIMAKNKRRPQVIPTGVMALDYALGIGGLPRGRIGMIYGYESSWKSTVCLRTIAQVQKMGGQAIYVDAERTFDPKWAKAHGIDMDADTFGLTEPNTAEEAFDEMTKFIEDGVDIIVLDSLVALSPKKEMYDDEKGTNASITKNAMGVFPKQVSQWCRTNIGRIADNGTLFIVINQLRDNLGMFGSPTSIPGGRAIKFYSSFMIGMRKLGGKDGEIKDGEDLVGSKYKLKIDKLKVAQFGREAEFSAYGAVLDNYSSLLEIGLREEIILRDGNKKYTFKDLAFNGKPALHRALFNDVALYDSVYKELLTKIDANIFDPFAKIKNVNGTADIELPSDDEEIVLESSEPEE